jgi:uncharacterized protein (DUF1330 family)
MRELLRSNDLVYLSFVSHVLAEAGIDFLVLDGHMSVMEGSVGAIPRRLAVPDSRFDEARRLLGNASLTNHG